MKVNKIGKKSITAVNSLLNLMMTTIIIILLIFAGYALWDSNQIHYAADKSHYAVYKPTAENEGKSFKELQALNEEVIAWLSVYGTNIDYPVTQGQNNMKYVDTNAEGRYSLSGAIFLDSNNSRYFNDFNSVLYGHHMAKKVMFGEIGNFSDENMFDSHRYGNLYFDGKDHGIEFFAFLHADAYDTTVFAPGVNENYRQAYLDNLFAKARYTRDAGVTAEDQIILLSTCSSDSTNGRDILIGKLTEETYEDPFLNTKTNDGKEQTGTDGQSGFVKEIYRLEIILAALLIIIISIIYYTRKRARRRCNKHE